MKTPRIIVLLAGLGLGLVGGLVYVDSQQQGAPDARQVVGALGPGAHETTPVTPDDLAPQGWVFINGGPDDPAEIQVLEKEPGRQRLEFKLPGFYLETVAIGGIKCSRISVPDLIKVQEAGLPELPVLAASLVVPAGGRTYLKIVEHRVREIKVDPVEPSLGHVTRNIDPATLEPHFSDFYTGQGQWPKEPVEMSAPFTIREYEGVNVRLNPLRYDAGKGLLLVTEHVVVDVVTEGGHEKLTDPDQGVDLSGAGFGRVYGRFFANYREPALQDKYERLPVSGRMLIVSHDAFAGHLHGFADWKRQRGIDVTVVTVGETGGTAAGIGQAIAGMYAEPRGLTWVILVGDKAQVPTNTGLYDGSDSDSRYAMVSGGDIYPDLFVSRISAGNTTELQTQLNRFIAYEKSPDTGSEADWYSQAVGIASDEGNPSDFKRADLLRDDLLAYGYDRVDQIYQGLGGTTGAIAAAVDKGSSLINYLGHGSGYGWTSVPFSSSDVRNLDNAGNWPWIIDVACSNGDFALPECFAEAWLRAGSPDRPTGAVAMIAATSLAPWVPPTVMQAEAVDLLTSDQAQTIGSLYYSGLMKVLDQYAGLDVAMQVMEQNVIFGDCSLMVRTSAPGSFSVAPLADLPAGTGSLEVDVGPHPGAVVTVTSSGTLHGVALADASGRATVDLTVPVDDRSAVTVTVTAYNMVPHIQTLAVVDGSSGEVSPEPDMRPMLPERVTLLGNHPNPFNPSTHIAFELPRDMRVRLSVYDVRGSLVRQLTDDVRPAGRNEVLWDGRDGAGRAAASGVYLYWLRTEDGDHAGRMLLTK